MYQYSFANTSLHVDKMVFPGSTNPPAFKVDGYKAGEDLITIARMAPIATPDFTAYGKMVVSLQRNRSTAVGISLLMNSEENTYFQDWANYLQSVSDSDTGDIFTPIDMTFTDVMGNDKVNLHNGVILNMPAITRGLTVSVVKWNFIFEEGVFARGIGKDNETL